MDVKGRQLTCGLLPAGRAMQFITGLIELLLSDSSMSVSQAASQTYKTTLSKYHGILAGGVFTVCHDHRAFASLSVLLSQRPKGTELLLWCAEGRESGVRLVSVSRAEG